MLLAALMVALDVGIERWQGNKADIVVDDIRNIQQKRIADATAELSALARLASGVRAISRDDLSETLRPFAVQLFVQAIGEPPWGFRSTDDIEKKSKEYQEAQSFASDLSWLERVGWKYKFIRDPIFNGDGTDGVRVYSWTKPEWLVSRRPPPGTPEAKAWDSANALTAFLKEHLNLWTTRHITVTVFGEYPNLPKDGCT